MNNITKFLDKLNVPKHVCHHMMGANHTPGHRIVVGVVVMMVGVCVSKLGHDTYYVVHLMFDGTGYLLHAIGAVPILEHLNKNS